MTIPSLIYLAMGLLVARIMLDDQSTRGFTWLQWLQYLVDAARITMLWPLVLLAEKVQVWLKTEKAEQPITQQQAAISAPPLPAEFPSVQSMDNMIVVTGGKEE